MKIVSKSSLNKQAKSRMGFKQHFDMPKDNEHKIKTDDWYDDQPEWGTPKSTSKAKKKTPCQNEEVAAGANTGSIPNPIETSQGKKRKYSVLTRHYIEIAGKRKKVIK